MLRFSKIFDTDIKGIIISKIANLTFLNKDKNIIDKDIK